MTLHQRTPHRFHSSPRLSVRAGASVCFKFFLLVSLLLLIVCPVNLFAQEDENGAQDEVIRVRTDLVTVPMIVTDSRGRRISGLTRDDFAVSDNSLPVEIEYFAAGTERVALLFALDTSGSVREILTQQREAAAALFSRFGRGSRVAVLQFDEKPRLVVPFTTAAEATQTAFSSSSLTNHRTAIFDAAFAATQAFAAPSDRAERRIIILISDGLDTASTARAADAVNHARAGGISFYVIHLPIFAPRDGRLAPRPASKGFRALAEQTGGRYFMLGDAQSALNPRAEFNLASVFQAIEEDLQGQYVIGYYPGDAARLSSLHRIEVKLKQRGKQKLRLQTLRTEYNLKAVTSDR